MTRRVSSLHDNRSIPDDVQPDLRDDAFRKSQHGFLTIGTLAENGDTDA